MIDEIQVIEPIPIDNLEDVATCVVCGKGDYITDFLTDIQVERQTTAWKLCENCGHVFVSPQPTQKWLDGFYQEGYREMTWGLKEDPENINVNSVREETGRAMRLSMLVSGLRLKIGRHLDIGSSTGVLLAAMIDRLGAQQSWGVEPNDAYRQFAISAFSKRPPKKDLGHLGDPHLVSNIAGVPKSPKFDLITCIHTLEHLKRPDKALARLRKMILKSGLLVVETPILYGGIASPLLWPHLHAFTPTTLERLLVNAGFYVNTVETLGCIPPLWPPSQHLTVMASTSPPGTDLKSVLGRYNLYRNVIGIIQQQAHNAQPTYRMG